MKRLFVLDHDDITKLRYGEEVCVKTNRVGEEIVLISEERYEREYKKLLKNEENIKN